MKKDWWHLFKLVKKRHSEAGYQYSEEPRKRVEISQRMKEIVDGNSAKRIIEELYKRPKRLSFTGKEKKARDFKEGVNLVYGSIESYKRHAYLSIFSLEYGLKNLLESIIDDTNNIPDFHAYIVVRQVEKWYLFVRNPKSECEGICREFEIIATGKTFDLWQDTRDEVDNSDVVLGQHEAFTNCSNEERFSIEPSVNPVIEKVSSILNIKKEELFIHTIWPNYKAAHHPEMDYCAYLLIQTEGFQNYVGLVSFYKRFAFSYEDAIVLNQGYSWTPIEEIISDTVKDIYADHGSSYRGKYYHLPSFSLITKLSSMLYEGGKFSAGIIIEDENCVPDIAFRKPTQFDARNVRAVRKLLEIVNENDGNDGNTSGTDVRQKLALLVKTYQENGEVFPRHDVVGFADANKYSDSPVFVIEDNLIWRYDYKRITKLCYSRGRYIVRKREDYDKERLKKELDSTFDKDKIEQLLTVIAQAWTQKHGTTILITDDAKCQIIDLCDKGRGYQIEEVELFTRKELIPKFTSIDGAMIIDSNCYCYAIGVILDGQTMVDGNMERGARYNSAKNYIAVLRDKRLKAVAVIVSEDRTMDVISTENV